MALRPPAFAKRTSEASDRTPHDEAWQPAPGCVAPTGCVTPSTTMAALGTNPAGTARPSETRCSSPWCARGAFGYRTATRCQQAIRRAAQGVAAGRRLFQISERAGRSAIRCARGPYSDSRSVISSAKHLSPREPRTLANKRRRFSWTLVCPQYDALIRRTFGGIQQDA